MPDIWRLRFSMADLILPGRNPRTSGLLPALAWAAVLLWLAAGLFMTSVPLSGDEVHYANAANAISDFLRGDLTLDAMLATVVGYGWFVPGMSLLLTPLYMFGTPDGPIIRIYVLLIMFLLWLWTLREVHAEFGRRYVAALLVFPGLEITWHLFATTAWGETGAGLFLVIVFVRTCRIARQALAGESIAVNDVAALELALILAFYLRGSLLVVALAVHIFILSMFIFCGQGRSMSRKMAMIVGGGLCFGIAVAPWSIAASRTLGDLVIATSTPVLSFGITFGSAHEICFGPCPGMESGGNVWIEAANFSRVYASAHGVSEIEAQRRMSAYATRALTAIEYLRRVQSNFARLALSPAQFTRDRFLPSSSLHLGRGTVKLLGYVALAWTSALYFPGLLALLIGNLTVIRKDRETQIQSLSFKMLTLCLLLQPFLHPAHSRYWPTFAPLMALSAAFLLTLWAARSTPKGDGAWPLLAIQWAYVTAFAAFSLILVAF
jgi:hypothetical protein